MKFAYTRRGGPLLDWSGPTPPSQTRAGETRSLGAFYSTTRTSSALRRYGGRSSGHGGDASGYEMSRSLGSLDIPRPGAPEVISGYESPQPGAAIIHLGGYIPEGAARTYGGTFLGADAPATPLPVAPLDLKSPLIRRASMLAAAYHGAKRHHGSILWGLLWGAAAFAMPITPLLVPAFALAQGYGKAEQCR